MIENFRLVNELTMPLMGSDEKEPELISIVKFGNLIISIYDNGELVTNYRAYVNTIVKHKDEIIEILSQTCVETTKATVHNHYGNTLEDFMQHYGVYAAEKLKGAVLVPATLNNSLINDKDNYPITFNNENHKIYTTVAVGFTCDDYVFNYNTKQTHYIKPEKDLHFKLTWDTVNKDGIDIVNEAKKLYNHGLISRTTYRDRTSEIYIDEFHSSWNLKIGFSNIVSTAKYFGNKIELAGKRTYDGGTTSEGAPWQDPKSYYDEEPIKVHINKNFVKMIPDGYRCNKHIIYILDNNNEPYPTNVQVFFRTKKQYTNKYGKKCYQYLSVEDIANAKKIVYNPEFVSNKKGYFYVSNLVKAQLNTPDYANTVVDFDNLNVKDDRCKDPTSEFAWVSTGKSYLRKLIGISKDDKLEPLDEYMLIWSKLYSENTELSVSKDTIDYIISIRRYLNHLAKKLGVKYNKKAYFYAKIVEPRTSINADAYADKYNEYGEYYDHDDESDNLDTKKFDTSYYDWDPFEVVMELYKVNIKCDLGVDLSKIHCKKMNPLCSMWIRKKAVKNNLIKIRLK